MLNKKIDDLGVLGYLYSNRGVNYFELGQYKQALKDQTISYEYRVKSGAMRLIADNLFNIIRIARGLNNSNLMESTFKKFKELPDHAIKYQPLIDMARAYMMKINANEALSIWESVSSNESLEFGYKIICQEEIIKIHLDNWIQNQGKLSILFDQIDKTESFAKEKNLSSVIVKVHIIRGLIYKRIFEFDKALECLNYALTIASKFGLPYHENLVYHEIESVKSESQQFQNIYNKVDVDKELVTQNKPNEILNYLNNLQKILSAKYEK